jgi:hypothetical protein
MKSFIIIASDGLHATKRTLTPMTTVVYTVMLDSTLAPVINKFEAYLFFVICVGVNNNKKHTHTQIYPLFLIKCFKNYVSNEPSYDNNIFL